MYKNQGTFTKFEYFVGKHPIIFLISIITVIIIIYYVYFNFKYRNEIVDVNDSLSIKKKFTFAIYNALISRGVSDQQKNVAILLLKSYTKDDNLFSRFPHWRFDTSEFNDLLGDLEYLIVLTTLDEYSHLHEKMWQCILHSLETIYKNFKMNALYVMKLPWGKNWYPFSISYPKVMTYAVFIHYHTFGNTPRNLIEMYKRYVNKFIINPELSLGWNRDGANSLMMSIPYLGCSVLENTKTYQKKISVATFQKYLKILQNPVVSSGEGIYEDGGYVTHKNSLAYGYVFESFWDTMILAMVFNYNTIVRMYKKISSLLTNPTISAKSPVLFRRSPQLHNVNGIASIAAYGFDVISSCNIISIKTTQYTLHYCGRKSNLAFYEADKSYESFSQFSVMSKMYFYAVDDTNQTRLYTELETRYPGIVSYNNQAVKIPTITSTTSTFVPAFARSCICKLDTTTISIYNQWDIDEFNLVLEELTIFTSYGYTTSYLITKKNSENTNALNLFQKNNVSDADTTDNNENNNLILSLNLGRCIDGVINQKIIGDKLNELNITNRIDSAYNGKNSRYVLENNDFLNKPIQFENNSTVVHEKWTYNATRDIASGKKIVIKKNNDRQQTMGFKSAHIDILKNPDGITPLQSFQLNDVNDVVFSNFHNDTNYPEVSAFGLCIKQGDYITYFHEDHLFLLNNTIKKGSISSISSSVSNINENLKTYKYNIGLLHTEFGKNIKHEQNTMIYNYKDNIATDITEGLRKYSNFHNINLISEDSLLYREYLRINK
ncbi:MAG: odv-e66 [Cotesia congregata filamentous virus 2]